jgi:hypothetical protein
LLSPVQHKRKLEAEAAPFYTETFTEAPELGNSNSGKGGAKDERQFADDFSRRAFGADVVVVSTTMGLPEDGDEQELDGLRELATSAPAAVAAASSQQVPHPPRLKKQRKGHHDEGPKTKSKRRHVNAKVEKQRAAAKRSGKPHNSGKR